MRNKKIIFILILLLVLGCKEANLYNSPEEYIRKSEAGYSMAVSLYQELISKSDNPSPLYLKLGQLYFSRGSYELAISAFNNSSETAAKKFLALSFYHLGNYLQN